MADAQDIKKLEHLLDESGALDTPCQRVFRCEPSPVVHCQERAFRMSLDDPIAVLWSHRSVDIGNLREDVPRLLRQLHAPRDERQFARLTIVGCL